MSFQKRFQQKDIVLSHEEHSQPLNKEGILDKSVLTTPFGICHKSQKPNFWDDIYSLILLARPSLVGFGTFSEILNVSVLFIKTKKVISKSK